MDNKDETDENSMLPPSSTYFSSDKSKKRCLGYRRRHGSGVLAELETISENNTIADFSLRGNSSFLDYSRNRAKDNVSRSFSANSSSFLFDSSTLPPAESMSLLEDVPERSVQTTPPSVLRQRVREARDTQSYLAKELEELREFTTLEKQILNSQEGGLQEQYSQLKLQLESVEEKNSHLKKEIEESLKLANTQRHLITDLEKSFEQSQNELNATKTERDALKKELDCIKRKLTDEEFKNELSESKWKRREEELKKSLDEARASLEVKETRLCRMEDKIRIIYSDKDAIAGSGDYLSQSIPIEKLKSFENNMADLYSMSFRHLEPEGSPEVTSDSVKSAENGIDTDVDQLRNDIEKMKETLICQKNELDVMAIKLREKDDEILTLNVGLNNLSADFQFHCSSTSADDSSDSGVCLIKHDKVLEIISCEFSMMRDQLLKAVKSEPLKKDSCLAKEPDAGLMLVPTVEDLKSEDVDSNESFRLRLESLQASLVVRDDEILHYKDQISLLEKDISSLKSELVKERESLEVLRKKNVELDCMNQNLLCSVHQDNASCQTSLDLLLVKENEIIAEPCNTLNKSIQCSENISNDNDRICINRSTQHELSQEESACQTDSPLVSETQVDNESVSSDFEIVSDIVPSISSESTNQDDDLIIQSEISHRQVVDDFVPKNVSVSGASTQTEEAGTSGGSLCPSCKTASISSSAEPTGSETSSPEEESDATVEPCSSASSGGPSAESCPASSSTHLTYESAQINITDNINDSYEPVTEEPSPFGNQPSKVITSVISSSYQNPILGEFIALPLPDTSSILDFTFNHQLEHSILRCKLPDTTTTTFEAFDPLAIRPEPRAPLADVQMKNLFMDVQKQFYFKEKFTLDEESLEHVLSENTKLREELAELQSINSELKSVSATYDELLHKNAELQNALDLKDQLLEETKNFRRCVLSFVENIRSLHLIEDLTVQDVDINDKSYCFEIVGNVEKILKDLNNSFIALDNLKMNPNNFVGIIKNLVDEKTYLETLKNNLESEIKKLNEKVVDLDLVLKNKLDFIDSLVEENSVMKNDVRELKSTCNKYSDLQESFEKLEVELQLIKAEYEECLTNCQSHVNENNDLKIKLMNSESVLSDKLKSIEDLEMKLKEMEKTANEELSELRRVHSVLEKEFTHCNEELSESRLLQDSLKARINEIYSEKDELKIELDTRQNEILGYYDSISHLKEENATLSLKVQNLEFKESELSQLKLACNKLEEDSKSHLSKINDLEVEKLTMLNQIASLEEDAKLCLEKMSTNDDLIKENEKVKASLVQYEAEITALKSELAVALQKLNDLETHRDNHASDKSDDIRYHSLVESANSLLGFLRKSLCISEECNFNDGNYEKLFVFVEEKLSSLFSEKIELTNKLDSFENELLLAEKAKKSLDEEMNNLIADEQEKLKIIKRQDCQLNEILSLLECPSKDLTRDESWDFIQGKIQHYKSQISETSFRALESAPELELESKIRSLELELLEINNFKRNFSRELQGLKPNLRIPDMMKMPLEELKNIMFTSIMEKEEALVSDLERSYEMKLTSKEDLIRRLEEESKRNAEWIQEIEYENNRLQNECKSVQNENENLKTDLLFKVEKITSLENEIRTQRDSYDEKHELESREREKHRNECGLQEKIIELTRKLEKKEKESQETSTSLQNKSDQIFRLERALSDIQTKKSHLEDELRNLKNDVNCLNSSGIKSETVPGHAVDSYLLIVDLLNNFRHNIDFMSNKINCSLDERTKKVAKLELQMKEFSFHFDREKVNSDKANSLQLEAELVALKEMVSEKADQEERLLEENKFLRTDLESLSGKLTNVLEVHDAIVQSSLEDQQAMDDKVAALNECLKLCQEELESCRNENVTLITYRDDCLKVKEELTILNQRLTDKNEELSQTQLELKDLELRYNQVQDENLKLLRNNADFSSMNDKIVAQEKEIEGLKTEMADMSRDYGEEFARKEEALLALKKEIATSKEETLTCKAENSKLQAMLDESKAEIKKRESLHGELTQLYEARLQELQSLKDLIQHLGDDLEFEKSQHNFTKSELTKDLLNLQQDMSELKEERSRLQSLYEQSRAEVKLLKDTQGQTAACSTQLGKEVGFSELREKIKSLEIEKVALIEQLEFEKSAYNSAKLELVLKEDELIKLQKAMDMLRQEVEQLKASENLEISSLNDELVCKKNIIEELETTCSDLKNLIEQKNIDVKNLCSELDSIRQHSHSESDCPYRRDAMESKSKEDEINKLLAHERDTFKRLQTSLEQDVECKVLYIIDLESKLKQENKAYKNALHSNSELNKKIFDYEEKIRKLEEKINNQREVFMKDWSKMEQELKNKDAYENKIVDLKNEAEKIVKNMTIFLNEMSEILNKNITDFDTAFIEVKSLLTNLVHERETVLSLRSALATDKETILSLRSALATEKETVLSLSSALTTEKETVLSLSSALATEKETVLSLSSALATEKETVLSLSSALESEKETNKHLDEECEIMDGLIKRLQKQLSENYMSQEEFDSEKLKFQEETKRNEELTADLKKAEERIISFEKDLESEKLKLLEETRRNKKLKADLRKAEECIISLKKDLESERVQFEREKRAFEINITNLLEDKEKLRSLLSDLEKKLSTVQADYENLKTKDKSLEEGLLKEINYLKMQIVQKNTKLSNLEMRLESGGLPFQKRAEAAERKVQELMKEIKNQKISPSPCEATSMPASSLSFQANLEHSRRIEEYIKTIKQLEEDVRKLEKRKASLKKIASLRHEEIKKLQEKLRMRDENDSQSPLRVLAND